MYSTPAEHLIVAADFYSRPMMGNTIADVRSQTIQLVNALTTLNVVIKIEDALRASGYNLIHSLREDSGFRVFADLKITGIWRTLERDMELLQEFRPDFLTITCENAQETMSKVVKAMPDTAILALTHPSDTNISSGDLHKRAVKAWSAKCTGIICSGKRNIEFLARNFPELMLVAVEIRPQKIFDAPGFSLTPREAILAGADMLVVGAPILMAENPYDATKRIIDEIDAALRERNGR